MGEMWRGNWVDSGGLSMMSGFLMSLELTGENSECVKRLFRIRQSGHLRPSPPPDLFLFIYILYNSCEGREHSSITF